MDQKDKKRREKEVQLLKAEASLSQRVARGGAWVFALRVLEKILQLIRLVIVARLLAPNDFGLFGIALLAMSALETFSQTGFQAALVQKKDDITQYLDTAWSISVIRGIILFILLFLSAPYIALFFNSAEASLIIQVIGVSVFLTGFTNVGIVSFQRELKFNKQFVYQLSTTLADFIVVVSAALAFKNVWALIFGLLAGSLTGLVASYAMHPYRPHFRLELEKTRELFGFGKWVWGATILVFLITQGDDAFVGKFLGVTMLGLYQVAYRISNMPATEITHVISQVTFPAYSKIQDDLPRLREAYVRVLQLTAFLSFPIAGLIFILAPDFTKIFLGVKWMPMVPAMQVLVLAGLVRSIAATTGPLFYAVGQPKVDTRWQIVRLLIIVVFIYPFTMKWGIQGTSIVVLLSIFAATVGFHFKAIKLTGCDSKRVGKTLALPLINGVILVFAVFVVKSGINIDGILGFSLYSAIGILTYLGVGYLFDRYFNYRMRSLIRESLDLLRGF